MIMTMMIKDFSGPKHGKFPQNETNNFLISNFVIYFRRKKGNVDIYYIYLKRKKKEGDKSDDDDNNNNDNNKRFFRAKTWKVSIE